jgi:DNA-directed RNA polymerase specialized sigma24 family protein
MSLDNLLAAARTGDAKARDALARALYKILRPYFRRSFPRTVAEDLVQSTMVLIFRKIDGDLDRAPSQSFEALVRVTARGVGLMARRSWAREQRRRIANQSMVVLDTSLSERLARDQRVTRIVEAIDELGTTDQRALSGWAKETNWRALAEVERVARATLRTRVHRALARLVDLVQRRAGSEPEPSAT